MKGTWVGLTRSLNDVGLSRVALANSFPARFFPQKFGRHSAERQPPRFPKLGPSKRHYTAGLKFMDFRFSVRVQDPENRSKHRLRRKEHLGRELKGPRTGRTCPNLDLNLDQKRRICPLPTDSIQGSEKFCEIFPSDEAFKSLATAAIMCQLPGRPPQAACAQQEPKNI